MSPPYQANLLGQVSTPNPDAGVAITEPKAAFRSGRSFSFAATGSQSQKEIAQRLSACPRSGLKRSTTLAGALAYHLQAAAFGDLSGAAKRELAQIAKGKRSQPLASGMRIVREWHGTTHVVTVDENGRVVWNGREWTSLSAIAKAITGQQWSGPAFFGLRKAIAS